MDPKVLQVTGLEELDDWLARLPRIAIAELKAAMTRAVMIVKADLAQYPPATASNQPGRFNRHGKPMGYYERGRGWWYPVMRQTTLPAQTGKARGAIKAKRGSVVAGYKLAAGGTSEVLGKSWVTEVRTGEGAVIGVLGNDTSYLDYVQGDRQARIHRAHDWQTIQQVLDADEEKIVDEFEAAVSRITASVNESKNEQR